MCFFFVSYQKFCLHRQKTHQVQALMIPKDSAKQDSISYLNITAARQQYFLLQLVSALVVLNQVNLLAQIKRNQSVPLCVFFF